MHSSCGAVPAFVMQCSTSASWLQLVRMPSWCLFGSLCWQLVKCFPCLLRGYALETSAPGTPRNLYRYIKAKIFKIPALASNHTYPDLSMPSTLHYELRTPNSFCSGTMFPSAPHLPGHLDRKVPKQWNSWNVEREVDQRERSQKSPKIYSLFSEFPGELRTLRLHGRHHLGHSM